jgi:predicted neuraminidase
MLFEKDGAFTRHPLLVLQDGTWLMPLTYVTSKGIGQGAETNFSVTKLSRDEGKTWKECLIPQSFGKVQPSVVQVSSTKLIAFFRSRAADSIFRSVSSDGCKWTVPEPTTLPNNNASVQAFRLRNGHIVIAFDNSKDTVEGGKKISALRKPLTVALSEDEGNTWKYVRDLEVGREGFGQAERKVGKPGREEYSYPTILETRNGVIYVAYTFRRQTIKVVSFREDWLRHGDSVGVYRKPM